jgi:uncharacterized iron-regulated protein
MLRGLTLVVMIVVGGMAEARAEPTCRPGGWLDPSTGEALAHDAVLAGAAGWGIVLLGETHDSAEHHRWQLSVLAGLLALRPDLVIGFEAFPARLQPILDRWSEGALDEAGLLAETNWRRIWRVEPELYLPLFHLARLFRLPMLALNIDRSFVTRVAAEGWAAIPSGERQGLSDPEPPTASYRDRLANHFRRHGGQEDDRPDAAFERFVEAQLTWDRAMAEVLARTRRQATAPLVVGIIGSEHLRHREGVPHQLTALGHPRAAVLLPHEVREGCGGLEDGEADALFLLDSSRGGEAGSRRRD